MQVFERTEKHIDIVIPQTQQKFDERPTVVLIHGWKGVVDTHRYFHFSSQGFDDIGRTFEKYHNVNVVRVEWGNGVVSSYGTAVRNLPEMAQEVATFLDEKLGKSPVLWRNLTIVGHSLGAQMSGKLYGSKSCHESLLVKINYFLFFHVQLFQVLLEKLCEMEKLEQLLVLILQVFMISG